MTHKYFWVYPKDGRSGYAETACGRMAGPPISRDYVHRWAKVDCADCLEWALPPRTVTCLSGDRR